MEIGNRLGVAGLITAFASVAISILWPDQKWIGWAALLLASLLGLAWAYFELRDWSRLYSLGVFAFGIVVGWFIWGEPTRIFPTFPRFVDVYKRYKARLGKAIDVAHPAGDVSAEYTALLDVYDKGKVIWLKGLTNIFVLHEDQTYQKYDDSDHDLQKKWHVLKDRRAQFPDTPKDKLPPYGVIAMRWDEYKDVTGWKHWGCIYKPKSGVAYQYFEHGTMIGPFCSNIECLDGLSLVFVFTDDGKYYSAKAPNQTLTCDLPEVSARKK